MQNDSTGRAHPIYYASRLLTIGETKYNEPEKLAVSVLFACSKFKHYLLSSSFPIEVQCAQDGFKMFIQQAHPTGRAARFMSELQQYDLIVKGVKGQRALQSQILLELGRPPNTSERALSDKPECCILES